MTRHTRYFANLAGTVALCVISAPLAFSQDKPDWQKHIDWSIGNHTTDPGETNCVDQYLATEAACITGGGRACLMARAIDSAKANNCSYAMRLTLITQCHNGGAQQAIGAEGQAAVCYYLKTK